MYCHYKITFIVYLILTSKFLLKTNQNNDIGYRSNELKMIGIYKNKIIYINIGMKKIKIKCAGQYTVDLINNKSRDVQEECANRLYRVYT